MREYAFVCRFTDESLWSQEFIDFVKECLVKDYEERPMSFELAEHEFLKSVPQNTANVKVSIMHRVLAMRKGEKTEPKVLL